MLIEPVRERYVREAARAALGADRGTPVFWGPVAAPSIVGGAIVVPMGPELIARLDQDELREAADAAEELAHRMEADAAALRERAERLRHAAEGGR